VGSSVGKGGTAVAFRGDQVRAKMYLKQLPDFMPREIDNHEKPTGREEKLHVFRVFRG
jgi:hypothetical protein